MWFISLICVFTLLNHPQVVLPYFTVDIWRLHVDRNIWNPIFHTYIVIYKKIVSFLAAVQDMLSAKVQAQVQAQLGAIPAKT